MRLSGGWHAAVAFAVLLVVAAIATPTLAASSLSKPTQDGDLTSRQGGLQERSDHHGGDERSSPDRPTADDVSLPDLEANTTVGELIAAREIVASVDVEDPQARGDVNDTLAAINASIAEFRSRQFADSEAAFDHLVDAQSRLKRLSASTDRANAAKIDRASERLHTGARAAAKLAVLDANRSRASYAENLDATGQRRSVDAALASAVGALRRGEAAALGDDRRGRAPYDVAGNVTARRTATVQYRIAWNHSYRALDAVAAAAEPTLSLSQGIAIERNGTVLVSLRASLDAVRPYRYENVTVRTKSGEELDTIRLRSPASSVGNATAATAIDIGPDLENRTVTATTRSISDPHRSANATIEIAVDENRVVPERPDPDEYNQVAIEDAETGVSVAVAGEGVWERSISVANRTPTTDASYRMSPVVRIQNRTSVDNATVTIPLSTDVEATDDLAMLKWDPAENGRWRRLDTDVDAANDTASATVESFSLFVVVDESSWDDYRSETITLQERHVQAWPGSTNQTAAPGEQTWAFDDLSYVFSSPTVVNGTVYVTDGNGDLYAIDAATGGQKWVFETPRLIYSSPTVANGTVYFGGGDEKVYAVDTATGELEWASDRPTKAVRASPTVANGTVYVSSHDSNVYALDARTGETEWTFTEPNWGSHSSPSVWNGTVYVGSYRSGLFALNATTGEREWVFQREDMKFHASPTIADGTVYIGSFDGSLYAVNATSGDPEWTFDRPSDWVSSSPTVANGTVYVGARDTNLYAVNASTGDQKWVFEAPTDNVYSSPTVAGGTVYVGSYDGSLYAVDAATGEGKWTFDEPTDWVSSSPTVASGTVYVGSADGTLYAVGTDHRQFSRGSRVRLGTLGHVGDRAVDGVPNAGAGTTDGNVSGLALADSTGDGIPDAVAAANPPLPQAAFLRTFGLSSPRVDLDPLKADTDGDGLSDAEEVDVEYHVFREDGDLKLEARVTAAPAHPSRTDSDGDGLRDEEEIRTWETNAWIADTSGDGLNDLVDPAPREVTLPPEVDYRTERFAKVIQNALAVSARPLGAADGIEEITVRKYVNPWHRAGEWQTASERSRQLHGNWVNATYKLRDERLSAETLPAKVRIVVDDDDGNRLVIQHDRESGDVSIYAAAGVAATTGETFSPAAAFGVPGAVVAVGATVLATGAFVVWEASKDSIQGHSFQDIYQQPVPRTEMAKTWVPSDDLRLHLPRGETYPAPTGTGHIRGFGETYIEETTGLTTETIEQSIVQHQQTRGELEVHHRGKYKGIEVDPAPDPDRVGPTPPSFNLVVKQVESEDDRPTYVIVYVERDEDDRDRECGIDEDRLRMNVDRTVETTALTEYHGDRFGVDLQVDCPHDSEHWVRTTGGQGGKDLTDLNTSERGDIAEEHAAPTFLRERGLVLNETFEEAEDSGTLDTGFDLVAKDPETGEWYVVEAKFRSSSGSVSNTEYWFHETNSGTQMSNEWIDKKIQTLIDSEDERKKALGRELQVAKLAGNLHSEVIVVENQDQNHLTITPKLTDLRIDRVHIVKLDRVVD